MSSVKAFRLPDPGEGLIEAEIVSWRVKPGDTVKVNDIVVEIETAKSLVELPVPWAGTVAELLVPEGETVPVGTPIIAVDTGEDAGPGVPPATGGSVASPGSAPTGSAGRGSATSGADARDALAGHTAGSTASGASGQAHGSVEEEAVEAGKIGGAAPGGRVAVLVGYGPRSTEAKRRPRKGAGGSSPSVTPEWGFDMPVGAPPPPIGRAPGGPVLAKPPVRKFAKDHGVDLGSVTPSDGQIVSRADVEAYIAGGTGTAKSGGDGARAEAGRAAYGRGRWPDAEREVRIPIKGVRKMTAQAMVRSAFTAPHVTEFVTVDVTRTMKLVERLRGERDFRDVRVSPLLVCAKALLIACARNPGVNAAWDEDAQEIVQKNYVNLGIAAATPRGLVVPNIKDADGMSLRGLADALADLTVTAREGRTSPADMAGGTMTITNVGVFGIDTGTPILPPGESAILCFGAIRQRPWVVDGRVKVRWVTELALSFDHRLIDGDLGSRFLADVARVLERPSQALVWG